MSGSYFEVVQDGKYSEGKFIEGDEGLSGMPIMCSIWVRCGPLKGLVVSDARH